MRGHGLAAQSLPGASSGQHGMSADMSISAAGMAIGVAVAGGASGPKTKPMTARSATILKMAVPMFMSGQYSIAHKN